MHLIWTQRKYIKTKKFKNKYGMLTEELQRRSIVQLYYYPIFLFQRIFISGMIVFGYDYPFLQIASVIASNISMIAFLIIVRPFKEENQRVTTVIDELIIMACTILFIVFKIDKGMSHSTRKEIGWAVIGLIMFSVLKNFGVVIYFGFQSVRQKLRQLFTAEDEVPDTPSEDGAIAISTDSDDEDSLPTFGMQKR